jgi:hypothetical protein
MKKSFIPLDVVIQFLVPKALIRCRAFGSRALLVSVPETPMHKDYFSVPGQDNIRIARQVATMNPKSVSHAMNQGSHQDFRFGVESIDATHYPASLFP